MLKNLSIQILVKNNEEVIENTLKSIIDLNQELNTDIIIGDLGCKDATISIINKYFKKAKIIPVSLNNNLAEARNYLLKQSDSNWNFRIDPSELFLNGIEFIKTAQKGAYKVDLIQGDVISKEIRFWHKDLNLNFKNPVFETINYENSLESDIIITSGKINPDSLILAKNWLENHPFCIEAIYYTACANLQNQKWKDFLNYAEIYLHNIKKESISTTMIRYYYSMVKCYIEKDYESALNKLMPCIAKRPIMAEFWCLLGDIYYSINEINKAKSFYENAIILGNRRLNNDNYPIEISKYREYPQKMINACDKIKNSLMMFGNLPEGGS